MMILCHVTIHSTGMQQITHRLGIEPSSQIRGDMADSGIGLSYRPASLYSPARRAGTTTLYQSQLYPHQSGTMNLDLGIDGKLLLKRRQDDKYEVRKCYFYGKSLFVHFVTNCCPPGSATPPTPQSTRPSSRRSAMKTTGTPSFLQLHKNNNSKDDKRNSVVVFVEERKK